MATQLTITPQTTSVGVTNTTTTLTISSAIAGAATDAQGITFQNAARTISTASTAVSYTHLTLPTILLV